MLVTCYYYDERSLEYKRTNLKEMKMLEPTDREEFLYRQQRLYRDESKRIPMTLVRNGCRQGFREREMAVAIKQDIQEVKKKVLLIREIRRQLLVLMSLR